MGVGTLYRRFPSKELLIEATYRHEVQLLCEAAPELAASLPPACALKTWMERFMDFMAAKHGMADALRVVLTDDGERPQTRANLAEAIDHLLTACAGQGVTRAQVGAHDGWRSTASASSPTPSADPISPRNSSTCCCTAS
ncbi:TetR/AcrR family transcriptional regulator [Streptomyces mirabilis]|uniref:TetR/AcrR family transcriptional regulator n=1 Tax=Streptomyces mirabilis TaxID=68239 RepID=UPI0036AB065A